VSGDGPDWRLQLGDFHYLEGVTLTRRPWSAVNPEWDHDHCEFCLVHIGDHIFDDDPDTQLEGWTTLDLYHWVCQPCFEDFRDRFGWVVGATE